MRADPRPRGPEPLHVDTDPGVDDLLALALCLASPEVRIVGLTTVAGNAPLPAVTENAVRFLALAGEAIPVGKGAARPLRAAPVTAAHVHGEDGRLGVKLPPAPPPSLAAEEVFRQSLERDPPATVLALGPLTNVAALLERHPGLLERTEIVWMGGSLSRGNVTPAAEFNSYVDPDAADAVLGSGLAVRVIGLDATQQVRLCAGDLPPAGFGEGRRGRVLGELIERLMRRETALRGEASATLHDPCAAAALIAPERFRFEALPLRVRVDAGEERGRLVTAPEGSRPRVRYAVGVKGRGVAAFFLERIAAWARSEPEIAPEVPCARSH